MKLWQKDASQFDAKIEDFTVGADRELDLALAKYDIQGSLAHIQMLESVGLLSAEDYRALAEALKRLYTTAEAGTFVIEPGIEDVHSQVELLLTRELGEAGKKIHSGRSRNDQVLVDLKLFFRSEIRDIAQLTEGLFETLLQQSETYKDVLLPGYTHLQIAMVSSFGLWFGAYAETLCDDVQILLAAYKIVNQNPLGSGAGYGGSLPLNRTLTTELLGFVDLNYNVVHAQMGRGKTEQALSFALGALGATLSKMAMDVCLYMNQNFDFLTLPDELTTGSSIMPHKKNPDVFELLRAKANRLQSLPMQVFSVTSALPSGYHRDFQLLKEIMFPALREIKECLEIAQYMTSRLIVKTAILQDPKYNYLFTVEAVNQLVLQGVPFREAYQRVGAAVEAGAFSIDSREVRHTHEGSMGNLNLAEIRRKMGRVVEGFGFKGWEGRIRELTGQGKQNS